MRLLVLLAALVAVPVLAQPAPGGPAGHRLLFAPTARAIPAGAWRLGVTEFLIPTASVGLGGGVSLGAGVLVGPAPVEAGIVFVEPKLTLIDRSGLAVALGATSRVDPASSRGVDAAVFPHAVATVGAGTRPGTLALTLGLGGRVNVRRASLAVFHGEGPSPFNDTRLSAPPTGDYALDVVPAPAAWGGLELRASERVTVLVEAVAIPDRAAVRPPVVYPPCPVCLSRVDPAAVRRPLLYDLTGGAAVRYATRRVALDLGFGAVWTDDGGSAPLVEPAPWLNITVAFGS